MDKPIERASETEAKALRWWGFQERAEVVGVPEKESDSEASRRQASEG